MKIPYSTLLLFTLTYTIAEVIFSTVLADEVADSAINVMSPDQIEIIVDVWPKNILSGDCVYVLFYVKNKSSEVLAIQPIDFFDNITRAGTGYRATGYPYYRFMGDGGWGEFFRFSPRIEVDVTMISPGESCMVFTDIYVTPNRIAKPIYTDDGGHIMRELVEEPVELTVANFADKYVSSVQQPWPILRVTKRPEWQLVEPFLLGTGGTFHIPQKGWVETASGGYTVEQFLPPLDLIWIGSHLPDLSTWKAFEEKLSPGTLRDMFRLGRLQVQYLDGEQKAALDELRDWFAEMETIQSTVLAASLCLPKGLEEESENDTRFMFILPFLFVDETTKKAKSEAYHEAHKHYMAMRRTFDKIVLPYNTLPARKLRETNNPPEQRDTNPGKYR